MRITVPVPPTDDPQAQPEAPPTVEAAAPRPRVVLFVDDDPSVLAALKAALRKSSLGIRTAVGGREALALLEKEPVDVIVSDERMPRMSGAELLATVRERYPKVVRFMLTGDVAVETSHAVVNDELCKILSKPILPRELLRTIEEGLAQAEAPAEA